MLARPPITVWLVHIMPSQCASTPFTSPSQTSSGPVPVTEKTSPETGLVTGVHAWPSQCSTVELPPTTQTSEGLEPQTPRSSAVVPVVSLTHCGALPPELVEAPEPERGADVALALEGLLDVANVEPPVPDKTSPAEEAAAESLPDEPVSRLDRTSTLEPDNATEVPAPDEDDAEVALTGMPVEPDDGSEDAPRPDEVLEPDDAPACPSEDDPPQPDNTAARVVEMMARWMLFVPGA